MKGLYGGLIALAAFSASASADDVKPASAYRGVFICEKAPGAPDILHVPVDLVVRGSDVQFARPVFNLRGGRVVGSELGRGTVDAGGAVKLESTWSYAGVQSSGSYSGILSAGSGVLSGRQSWRSDNGVSADRHCEIALAPNVAPLRTAGD